MPNILNGPLVTRIFPNRLDCITKLFLWVPINVISVSFFKLKLNPEQRPSFSKVFLAISTDLISSSIKVVSLANIQTGIDTHQ